MKTSIAEAEKGNQRYWDEIAPVHLKSYQEVRMLRAGECVLDEIEIQEIGDVDGKRLLHLQCHIGTDSLSWASLGALVTGVDFSTQSLNIARELSDELNIKADFIQANIYDLPRLLEGHFDIVYTSRGVINWLRNLGEWGRIITHYLKPGGIFYIMEMHPFLNIFESHDTGDIIIAYDYFNSPEPIKWDDEDPDYADETYMTKNPSYEWQWSVSDIINALIKAGLQITFFHEYERLFFKRFPCMTKYSDRWYHLPQYAGRLPLIFSLKARKPG
jgi:SAM-dependent methyltransferase